YSLSLHLINTFLLLASLALTAWWSMTLSTKWTTRPPEGSPKKGRGQLIIGIVALVVVAMAGVVTALGDTLFPAHSLAQGIADDFAGTASFLIRLRVIHPALGIGAAIFIAFLAARQRRASEI